MREYQRVHNNDESNVCYRSHVTDFIVSRSCTPTASYIAYEVTVAVYAAVQVCEWSFRTPPTCSPARIHVALVTY